MGEVGERLKMEGYIYIHIYIYIYIVMLDSHCYKQKVLWNLELQNIPQRILKTVE